MARTNGPRKKSGPRTEGRTTSLEVGRAPVVEAYRRLGNQYAVANELGLAQSTVSHHLAAARKAGELPDGPIATGQLRARRTRKEQLPGAGRVKSYIITSAQNNTPRHDRLWRNLLALATKDGAEILVGRFTYNRSAWGTGSVKPGTEPGPEAEGLWYDPEIQAYAADERVQLAPGLVYCGEMNILPTAVRPLSGLETYTGTDSAIFPHAKIAMSSVPSAKKYPTKLCYTTGACTLRNYIGKKAGQKAEFHHAYGALYVQVDSDGDWFATQLSAGDDGTIYHLTRRVKDGVVEDGQFVKALVWGDIHHDSLEADIEEACWGKGGIKDVLHPEVETLDDLLDFRRRNHHDKHHPFKQFVKWLQNRESVEEEVQFCADFVKRAWRPWCQTVVTASNHDAALERWMRESDWRSDPVNAEFLLEANLECLRGLRADQKFYAPEWALRRAGCPDEVKFLHVDDDFVVMGVQLGDHGHNGPNGTRGTAMGYVRVGRKAFMRHIHTATIIDGLYVVGVMGALDQGYNVGPSSWSRTFGVLYETGKRTLVTMRGIKWRAERGKRRKR